MMEMLPRHSQYKAALERDPEYIEQVREAYMKSKDKDDEDEKWTPPMEEWHPVRDDLASILYEIRGLVSTVIGVAGGGSSQPEPPLRPETALGKMIQSAKIEKRKALHERLVGQLLPHKRK